MKKESNTDQFYWYIPRASTSIYLCIELTKENNENEIKNTSTSTIHWRDERAMSSRTEQKEERKKQQHEYGKIHTATKFSLMLFNTFNDEKMRFLSFIFQMSIFSYLLCSLLFFLSFFLLFVLFVARIYILCVCLCVCEYVNIWIESLFGYLKGAIQSLFTSFLLFCQ